MSAKSTGLMFQLKVNPISGNSEWVVIEEEIDDVSPEPMLATTSYLDMLNDSPRNRAYRAAIDKTVSKHRHVLDIWAMSGDDLSSSKGMITACESYILTMKLMKKVLHENNMNHKIRVFNKKSYELEVGVDIASRADVLVIEILDSELLAEGLIPTLQHAHDKLLMENYKTVPYRATPHLRCTHIMYICLMESTYLWKLHDLFNNEVDVDDGIHLVPKGKESILRVKPQQFVMHCDALGEEIRLLSEHFKVFEFDFWKRPDSHGETQIHIKAANDGTIHAVISWWVLQLDEEGEVFYSTSPKWISSPLPNNGVPSMYCDDSVFLSVAAAHVAKASHVISLFSGLGDKGSQYLQAVADENGYSMDRVQAVNTRKSQLTMNDTHQNKVDLLIAEPFYFGAEGMLPWHGLQFWSKRTMLDSMLSEDACIMPCKGVLKACAMSLPKLSDTYTIMEFDFLKPLSSCQGKAKVAYSSIELACTLTGCNCN
ncbi:hypothetical protein R6Q59_024010 [Mikania micrantha]